MRSLKSTLEIVSGGSGRVNDSGGLRIFLLSIVLSISVLSCSARKTTFSPAEWAAGDWSVRGSMALDIKERTLLANKDRSEVESLLGVPDIRSDGTWSYNVRTISRCYFWRCRLEIIFHSETGKVKDVLVSD